MESMEIGDCVANLDEEIFGIDTNSQFAKFDLTIGQIEDIVMGDEFQELQKDFFEKHSHEFEETDENKFIYSDIHKEYTESIESYLIDKLKEQISDFSMEEFLQDLQMKKSDMDSEIFEILFSFTDFLVFKDIMVTYKQSKEKPSDLFTGIVSVTSINRVGDNVTSLSLQSANISPQPGSANLIRASQLSAHESAIRPKPGFRPNSCKASKATRLQLNFASQSTIGTGPTRQKNIPVVEGRQDANSPAGRIGQQSGKMQNDDLNLLVEGLSVKPSPPSDKNHHHS